MNEAAWEFREMPGLQLTLPQARRLLNLDILTCSAALTVLEAGVPQDDLRRGVRARGRGERVHRLGDILPRTRT